MTHVAIIGAGPSGLLLSQLLHNAGISTINIECQSQEHVESRIRAGILEQSTVDLIRQTGIPTRMDSEGLVHDGFSVVVDGEPFRIDLRELTGGSTVMVYGQTEVTNDLIAAAHARGGRIEWEADDVALHDVDSDRPYVTYTKQQKKYRVDCDFIAGCDGFHGASRRAIPAELVHVFERQYAAGWMGVLADVPPCDNELIYCNHERGFALASMRSPTRSRYYIQCSLDENLDDWPDDRIWDELAIRFGPAIASSITRGPSIEKSIAPLRSFVVEPVQYGRLFLAGDAAHIVPPTGAKGLNLAAADVRLLSNALIAFYKGDEPELKSYSRRVLDRVWKAERFSWWFTNLTHRFRETDNFFRKMQIAELAYLKQSRAARTTMAENYVGLPF